MWPGTARTRRWSSPTVLESISFACTPRKSGGSSPAPIAAQGGTDRPRQPSGSRRLSQRGVAAAAPRLRRPEFRAGERPRLELPETSTPRASTACASSAGHRPPHNGAIIKLYGGMSAYERIERNVLRRHRPGRIPALTKDRLQHRGQALPRRLPGMGRRVETSNGDDHFHALRLRAPWTTNAGACS